MEPQSLVSTVVLFFLTWSEKRLLTLLEVQRVSSTQGKISEPEPGPSARGGLVPESPSLQGP